MMKQALLLVILSALPALALGQVYRWVDEDGKVHYSDKPVEQAERVDMHVVRPSTSDQSTADAAPTGSLEEQIAAEEDPVKKGQLQLIKQECDLARAVLNKYENAPFLVEKQADGTERFLTQDEMAAEKAKVQQQITSNCQ